MSLISRGETGSRQTPVSMRANVLLYSEFNYLGRLSMGSDFDADPQCMMHISTICMIYSPEIVAQMLMSGMIYRPLAGLKGSSAVANQDPSCIRGTMTDLTPDLGQAQHDQLGPSTRIASACRIDKVQ